MNLVYVIVGIFILLLFILMTLNVSKIKPHVAGIDKNLKEITQNKKNS